MVKFQLHHQQAFGLEIVARDPDSFAVTGVRCLFCVHLGREPAPENARRQRRKGVQVWQKFAPQNYRSHHEGQHAAQWARYQECSKAEKAAFFGTRKSGEEKNGDDGDGSGGGGVSTAAAAAAAVVAPAKEKRARGRPRTAGNSVDNAGGTAPIQWDERSEERLMQLRLDRFASWFADSASESDVHDGWVLVAAALAEEFGVPVDVDQCKAKFNLRKAPVQQRSRAEYEESSTTTSRNSVGGERQDPRSNRPQHTESGRNVGVGFPSPPGAVVAVVAASTDGSRMNVDASPATSAAGTPKRPRGRPRRIEEEPTLPVARSNNATISTLLNAEEPSVETPPPPPRKRQREHVEDAPVLRRDEAEVNGTSSSTDSSTDSSSTDVNTLLLTRILRVLEEHTEATKAQTRSNQELLAFLRQRGF